MRLVDLNPRWLGTTDGVEGWGVELDCPCGCSSRLPVPFTPALDGTPGPYGHRGWARLGDTFETLTLSPSILRPAPQCGWHGYIRNGEIVPA